MAIGFFLGLVLELALDNHYLQQLEKENRHLRIKLSAERRPMEEQIEIVSDEEEEEDYFKPW